ncbi:MAG TPA: glucose-6-phosphate dehydrogenase [Nitriliruptorales bacterium]|nr:glucose-6-phosphate dehydrogenase [Nitriliruptorales bacterium]
MTVPSDAVILFGASGDLARRKLFPALQELTRDGRLDPVPVIGVAGRAWSDDDLRDHAREGIERFDGPHRDEDAFARLARELHYVSGDYRDDTTYEALAEAVGDATRPLIYLAIPPSLFETVIAGLAGVGLNDGGRVVVEKPFGRDLDSARRLNQCLLSAFPEASVFRIDHFLGKATVLDLLVLRLGNTFLEPVWNSHYIDNVQITMAEDFGIEGRGKLYEEVGALRDVVQNHLLQIVSLVAMEPPVDIRARALRDEKSKVLRSIRTVDPDEVVRGQYRGYRDEEGVAASSQVETFVALRAWVDSWRWAGVPFYLRAGKRLATTATEVLVEFRRPPMAFFAHAGAPPPHPNHLVFRMNPGERVSLSVQIKQPGDAFVSRPVDLVYEYDERREGPHEAAYARLLAGAMVGDQTLFARADVVEEAWRIVGRLLQHPPELRLYEPGTWGPAHAEELIDRDGGWHDPR